MDSIVLERCVVVFICWFALLSFGDYILYKFFGFSVLVMILEWIGLKNSKEKQDEIDADEIIVMEEKSDNTSK